jgi:rubrerythrin
MTYYECTECGHMEQLLTEQVRPCPVCEKARRFEPAFVDGDAGVSF